MAPIKKGTKRCGKQTAGWLSVEAVDSRSARRRLERRYRHTKIDADRVAYRSACRSANKVTNESRRQYIGSKLTYASSDSRKRWRIVNDLLHMNDQNQNGHAFVENADSQRMCDRFSEFFTSQVCNIARTIADHLSVITSIPPAVNFDEPVNHVCFDRVSELEVKKKIDASPLKTSPLDFIPIWMIKDCSDIFSHLICKLGNLSFADGVSPDVFNIGQVTPLITKPGSDVKDPATLNITGKILERLAQKQLRK